MFFSGIFSKCNKKLSQYLPFQHRLRKRISLINFAPTPQSRGDQRNCVRLSIRISSHNGHCGHDGHSDQFVFIEKKRKTVQQLQRNLANLISTRWSLSQQFARVKALQGARGDHKGGPQTASLTSL